MAITQGVCVSYKGEIMEGIHSPTDTYKIALFTSAATLNKLSTNYNAANEVPNGGGYTTGGKVLTGFNVTTGTDKAWLSFDDVSWTSATFTARGALIYNDTVVGKPTVMVIDFGSDKTVSGFTFLVDFPADTEANALLRIN